MMTALENVVRPGEVVGGYRIEKKLGAGGFGKVYLAWRDGSPCALKFIHLESVGEWGWRELFIMLRHQFPNVVRLLSHFKWPEEKPEYLVLVMEYVPGPTLYQWARDNNPCARELVEKLLPLARALKAVHAKEVRHRDLKGDNVLVRETDGEPVLVDFGAGAMPNAPRVTATLAPANLRYRSPESVAFFLRQDRKRGESYDYAVTDEVYALGVILYVLATDVYPFWGPEDELMAEILAGDPKPPNVRNSRVPPALSELCLRLLDKDPHARVPNAEELCATLEKLLEEAKADPRWEMPLCYGWTVDGRTTEDAPELVGSDPQAWLRRWIRQKPKRGKPPAPPAEPPALPAPSTAKTVPPFRTRVGCAVPVLVAVVGLAVVVGLGLGHVRDQLRSPSLAPAPVQRVLTHPLPAEFSLGGPTPWATRVHEVAPPWKPPEADAGAAPERTDTPAPVTTVTLSKGTTGMKKKAPGSQVEKEKKGTSSTGANVFLAVTAAANMACPGAQVRKEPAPQACPAGAVETMTGQLGIPVGERDGFAIFPGWKQGSTKPVPVQEGPISLELQGRWGKLPSGTILSGQLCFGEKSVYGRITQAVTPTGDTFTVCMELWDLEGRRGTDIESNEGRTVKIRPTVEVKAVEHFE